MMTQHESFVPSFDLLFTEICVVDEEVHVLLGKLLTPASSHDSKNKTNN